MTEHTALTLARLSHHWLVPLMVPPVLFAVAGRWAGRVQKRTRAVGRVNRGATVALWVTGGLFCVSLGVLAVAFFHIGCATINAHQTVCLSNVKRLALG